MKSIAAFVSVKAKAININKFNKTLGAANADKKTGKFQRCKSCSRSNCSNIKPNSNKQEY